LHLVDRLSDPTSCPQELIVLWTVFTTLLVLWLLGIVSSYTFGGFIHVLLASAVAVVLLRVLQNPGSPE
jgi:hypothetical protein